MWLRLVWWYWARVSCSVPKSGVVGPSRLKRVIVVKGIDFHRSHSQELPDEFDVGSHAEVRAGAVFVRRNPHTVPVPEPRVAIPDGVEAPQLPTEPDISPGLPRPQKVKIVGKKGKKEKKKVTWFASVTASTYPVRKLANNVRNEAERKQKKSS